MKKVLSGLALALVLTTGLFAAPSETQLRQIILGRHHRHHHKNNNNNKRVYIETRTVWKGRKEYEDTYRITIDKNGKRHEKRISHVRIN